MSDDNNISRRKVLKTTAVGATIASTSARVTASESKDTTQYSEFGVTARVDNISNSLTLPYTTVDRPKFHTIQKASRTIHVKPRAPNRIVENIKSTKPVIFADHYHQESFRVHQSSNRIPTNVTNRDLRTTKQLHLHKSNRKPSPVHLEYIDGVLRVSRGENTTEVAPGEEARKQLSSFEAVVSVPKTTDELVEAPDIPKRKRARKQKQIETKVEITPVLVARNYGSLAIKPE